jgi:predicted lipoprotein with Yx(FWY)xxD motif
MSRLSKLALITTVAVLAFAGVVLAKTVRSTLNIAKHGSVNGKREKLLVTAKNFAVYYLAGESTSKLKCTGGCLGVWLPIKSRHPTKAKGIDGKLSSFHRRNYHQVTLAGHPLYTFVFDTSNATTTYDGAPGPVAGTTWHIITPTKFAPKKKATTGSGGGGW